MSKVVARRRFAGPGPRLDQIASCRNDLEGKQIVAHVAVTYSRRSGRAGCDHPADGCVRPGIDRKKETCGAQLLVELLARYARLNHDKQIFRGKDRKSTRLNSSH